MKRKTLVLKCNYGNVLLMGHNCSNNPSMKTAINLKSLTAGEKYEDSLCNFELMLTSF